MLSRTEIRTFRRLYSCADILGGRSISVNKSRRKSSSILGLLTVKPSVFITKQQIHNVRVDSIKRRVIVSWPKDEVFQDPKTELSSVNNSLNRSQTEEEAEFSFPFIYLRDSCQCPDCFHQPSKSRTLRLEDLDLNTTATNAQICEEGKTLKIVWSDGHQSSFYDEWLKERLFAEETLLQSKNEEFTWNAESLKTIPTINFNSILNEDHALYDFIRHLEVHGLILVKEAQSIKGQINLLADRVSYLRPNLYGETFTIKNKVGPSNLAYTCGPLSPHTDLPYCSYVPGVQILHCLVNAEHGGENRLVDGFYVAEKLKTLDREKFEILTNNDVFFRDICADDRLSYHYRYSQPTIRLDKNGRVCQVTFNNHSRNNITKLPLDDVDRFYNALKSFLTMLNDPANYVQIKLEKGDILCFHNYRVLHSRLSFTVESGKERHLEGGYLDWDELKSRRRVLESALSIAPSEKQATI